MKAQNSVELSAVHEKKTQESKGKELRVGEKKQKESCESVRDNGEKSLGTEKEVEGVSEEAVIELQCQERKGVNSNWSRLRRKTSRRMESIEFCKYQSDSEH